MARKHGLGIKDYKDLKTWIKGKDLGDTKGWVCLKCGEKFDDAESAKAHPQDVEPGYDTPGLDQSSHIVTYR